MDNSQNYKRERLKIRAWSSKSVRIAIIYGLFALYSAIIIPFLPLNEGKAFISDTQNAGFVFAILTSFACIMLGIMIVAKLRKFGNGAIFALHKVFCFFLLGFSALTVFVRIIENEEIYRVLYYYAIFTDIAFGLGLIIIQIAQIMNPRLHCCKVKTFYYLFSLLTAVLVIVFAIMTEQMIEDGLFVFYLAGEEYDVFIKLIYVFSGFYAFCVWYHLSLPVNDIMEPFRGKFYKKHTATNQVGYLGNILFTIFLLVESIYFIIIECYIFLYAMIIGLAFSIGSIVWGALYNSNYEKKRQLELRLKREKEEFERIQREEREKREREAAEEENKCLAEKDSLAARDVEAEKEAKVYDADSDRFLLKAGAMLKQNAFVADPYSLKIGDFVKTFIEKLNAENVVLLEEDAASLVATFASSRVVFVSGMDKSFIKPVINAFSNAFGTDIFVQNYYEKFIYEPEYEDVPVEDATVISAEGRYETAPAESLSDGVLTEAETAESGYANHIDAFIDENNVAPIPEYKPEPVYIKKEKPFIKDENVIKENKRHGIVSGIFSANCLSHLLVTIFFDFTEDDVKENQVSLLRAISEKQEKLQIGRRDYLQRTDFYYDEEIVLPDNLWAVCFVNGENYKEIINKFGFKHVGYVDVSPLLRNSAGEEAFTDADVEVGNGYDADKKAGDAVLSYEGITDNLEKVEEDNYVSEETWSKIDKLISAIKLAPEKALDNRFLRQMEIYSSVQKATGKSDGEILDLLIAYRILPYISSCGALREDVDLLEILDKIIGVDNLPLSQKTIKDLGLNAIRSRADVE